MNVHVCGIDMINRDNIPQYQMQNKILEFLFPKKDEKNSNHNYILRFSKKPYWQTFLYKDKSNLDIIKDSILGEIQKAKKEQIRIKKH